MQWLPFHLHVYQPFSFARGPYSWFPYSELPAAPVFRAFAPSRPGVHTCLCRGMRTNTLCAKATSNLYPFFIRHFQIPFPDLPGHNTISVLTRVTIMCAFVWLTDVCFTWEPVVARTEKTAFVCVDLSSVFPELCGILGTIGKMRDPLSLHYLNVCITTVYVNSKHFQHEH